MSTYRFFKLNSGKRIAAAGEDHDFDDDLPALEHARSLANGYAISVWQGPRFVAYVEGENESPRAPSAQPRFSANRAS